MDSSNQETKPHQGQTIIAVFCITLSLVYFILAKASGLIQGWAAICAALSAIPSILFLTRSRKVIFLRISKLFSFPVLIGIILIINTWMKAVEG